MASRALVWLLTMTIANVPAQEECPCIKAARELGVKGEQFDQFRDLCEKLAAAAKAADDKRKKALGIEQAKRYKPPVRKFHEDVKALFDADLYRAFAKKLPPFYQPFPETLRGPGMVVEYLRYKVPSEQQKKFVEAWRRALVLVARSPHCLGYEYTQSIDDPEVFIVRLDWDSVDGHEQGFKKSPDYTAAQDCIRPFLALQIADSRHHRIIDRAN